MKKTKNQHKTETKGNAAVARLPTKQSLNSWFWHQSPSTNDPAEQGLQSGWWGGRGHMKTDATHLIAFTLGLRV